MTPSLMKPLLLASLFFPALAAATTTQQAVDRIIVPLMKEAQIPGMAVAIVQDGKVSLFHYGLADVAAKKPVSDSTLFELGSVSKTFTGTGGGVAMARGWLKLDEPVSSYSPQLQGTPWRTITMLQLATYTAGGLPLQLPDSVTDHASLYAYYQHWQPEWTPGTKRLYSNASIGLFGALMVKNSAMDFDTFMQKEVFSPLKLTQTWIRVPPAAMDNYAWGYKNGKPLRVTSGMLDAEAYGVKTSIRDMATFLQANIHPQSVGDATLAQGIRNAQQGYWQVGEMTQGLGWERYGWPVDGKTIIAGSDNRVALSATPVTALTPPQPATPAHWLHKTGSTNGFGAYIAMVPEKQFGIVMLANKNYPNPQRVTAAWQIMQALAP